LTACATDSAYRAKQLKVAIPGWLRQDLKDGLHQEEQLTSTKRADVILLKRKQADGQSSHSPM
jgi:hypothetical protein